MKFSEIFSPFKEKAPNSTSYSGKHIDTVSNIGAISFGRSLTGYHEEVTPHFEMARCEEMFERNPIVTSGVNQLVTYIIPNMTLTVHSEDEKTKNFLQEWHDMRIGMLEEVRNLERTKLITGNGYIEKVRVKTKNGEKVLDNIFNLNDAARIYINPNSEQGLDKYIFELPVGIQSFYYMGELHAPTYTKIQYMANYNWSFRAIYGIRIHGDNIGHYKSGWNRNNIYGTSPIASAIDADTVMDNIIRSWNAITKNRMLSKKIISISDKVNSDVEIDQDRLDQLQTKLEDDERAFHLFNIPLQMLQTDVSTAQTYDTMNNVMDYLRKMIMVSLLPQHLTPWSDSGTTQGTSESMPSFVMRLKAEQNQLIKFLNENIIGELRKTYPWLAKDATYVFDEPVVRASENYVFMAYSLVNGGILTPMQAQRYLVKLGVIEPTLIEKDKEEDNSNDNAMIDKIIKDSEKDKIEVKEKKPDKEIDKSIGKDMSKDLDKKVLEWMNSGKLG
jgi:hypothetical protein